MNNAPLKTETPIVNSPDQSAATLPAPANKRTKALVLVITVLAAILVLGLGIVPRLRAHDKLVQASQETARPTVVVTNVTRSTLNAELTLPANVRAFKATTLYSRANGYLSKWLVDIGAKVEAGQVLAEIDTPELD